jgi:hypothetical protein
VRLRQPIRDVLLAVWELEPERIAAQLPEGFAPITAGGRALLAVACFRNRLSRLGVLPVPPYDEIDVRTFVVDREGASAVFVFRFFVPAVGLAAGPFGVPVEVERIRVSPGRVSAPGIEVSAEYTPGEPAELGEREAALSTHSSAYWWKRGRLRRMTGGYHGLTWRHAELADGASFGPAAPFGVDPARCDFALAADGAELRADLPARRA